GNYGWPEVHGYVDRTDEFAFANRYTVCEPLIAWTPTVAPAGMTVYESDAIPPFHNSILLTTLKGTSLHVLKLNEVGDQIIADSILFAQVFGRLRSVCVAPNGDVYISTSNRDWNPHALAADGDDRIIRVSSVSASDVDQQKVRAAVSNVPRADSVNQGELLYANYCASCHQLNGAGVAGFSPPLYKAKLVSEADQQPLIQIVLNGKNEMPSFNFLSDGELAELLTYVRTRFGQNASAIAINDIELVKNKGVKSED